MPESTIQSIVQATLAALPADARYQSRGIGPEARRRIIVVLVERGHSFSEVASHLGVSHTGLRLAYAHWCKQHGHHAGPLCQVTRHELQANHRRSRERWRRQRKAVAHA